MELQLKQPHISIFQNLLHFLKISVAFLIRCVCLFCEKIEWIAAVCIWLSTLIYFLYYRSPFFFQLGLVLLNITNIPFRYCLLQFLNELLDFVLVGVTCPSYLPLIFQLRMQNCRPNLLCQHLSSTSCRFQHLHQPQPSSCQFLPL